MSCGVVVRSWGERNGDERGAHVLSSRERGQPLHVHAEQPRERVGLGLAQLRELLGHVLDRAVPLAQLYAGRLASADGPGGRREPVPAERPDERLGPGTRVGADAGQLDGIPLLEPGDALASEGRHRLRPDGGVQEAQRLGGEQTVPGRQRVVTSRGDDPAPGRAPATAGQVAHRVVLAHGALGGERVQVPAYRRRGKPEASSQLRRRHRTVEGDRSEDPLAGAPLGRRGRLLGLLLELGRTLFD